ncbi:MAG: hypothetical protein HY706_17715 [Candidatus Hydrogenedentes bacterium]|nr:hypothetical protein [Candidatus Hydrogenedentota bacterium]
MTPDTHAANYRSAPTFSARFLCLLCAVIMAFGWGYRGVVGHEGGAMLPGAMLGMALCLASGRLDWYRRAAVAGLFGAVGWAWGGSLSYMEHTMYSISDSFPDVYYGYSMLFLFGALWAGIGGAILGFAFTVPRSRLQQFVGPFTALCAVFFLTHLYFLFNEPQREAYEQFTADYFHDGEWLPALTTLIVSAVYWFARPKDRPATALLFWCAVAWWVGYLGFTKFGGLELAPPNRSESWGGVVGILAALLIYLFRRRNRAAFMLALYGILGGGLAFSLAVFIRHPVMVSWGPFAYWGGKAQWKLAEESFGFFMGLAIALGGVRLLRGGLRPPDEDEPRNRLDVYAVFVMLVALMWVNLRRAPMDWIHRYKAVTIESVVGLAPWVWYTFSGVVVTAVALYALYLYWQDRLAVAPATAQGKASLVFLFLIWLPAAGSFMQHFPDTSREETHILVDTNFWVLCAIATWLVLSRSSEAARASIPTSAGASPEDARWNVGSRYWLGWGLAPVFILIITSLSMAMQDGPHARGRKRFGPEAYHQRVTQLIGAWQSIGSVKDLSEAEPRTEDLRVRQIEFRPDHSVVMTLNTGESIAKRHRWQPSNVDIQLLWFGEVKDHPDTTLVPIILRGYRLYLPRPLPKGGNGYLVFERAHS